MRATTSIVRSKYSNPVLRRPESRPENLVANRIPLLDAEHGYRCLLALRFPCEALSRLVQSGMLAAPQLGYCAMRNHKSARRGSGSTRNVRHSGLAAPAHGAGGSSGARALEPSAAATQRLNARTVAPRGTAGRARRARRPAPERRHRSQAQRSRGAARAAQRVCLRRGSAVLT